MREGSLATIGFLGGGQLARMMLQKSRKMGMGSVVLDPDPECAAKGLCDRLIVGGLDDPDALGALVAASDVTTYDIEHIDVVTLLELERKGHLIRPAPGLLATIQDKLAQRQALARAGLPQPRFAGCETPGPASFEAFGYPLVQKARHGGYDGRGVVILDEPSRVAEALTIPSLLEEKVDLEAELALLVARALDGSARTYPVVEMRMDPARNLLDMLLVPARIPESTAARAREIALAAVEALDGVGIFGVELFLARDQSIFVNELAPRPHNSGHYTIEATMTCQFEQHLRAVAGLPLGSTRLMSPAAMINLLGEGERSGRPLVEGLGEALALEGVSFHFYGKNESRPGRKMGHVTVLDASVEAAREKAERVRDLVHVVAEPEGEHARE